jgi:hypothetical protein
MCDRPLAGVDRTRACRRDGTAHARHQYTAEAMAISVRLLTRLALHLEERGDRVASHKLLDFIDRLELDQTGKAAMTRIVGGVDFQSAPRELAR